MARMILLGKMGGFEISEQLIESLQAVYPVDVRAELAKMDVWLHCNAARRPVRMMVFVKAWLARAKPVDKTKGERRANIAGLCGYSNGVGPAALFKIRGELRQQSYGDVGRLPASGHSGRLADRVIRVVGGENQGGPEPDA
jgi:hypothetical protein